MWSKGVESTLTCWRKSWHRVVPRSTVSVPSSRSVSVTRKQSLILESCASQTLNIRTSRYALHSFLPDRIFRESWNADVLEKLYRIKLDAWSDCRRILAHQTDTNGITGGKRHSWWSIIYLHQACPDSILMDHSVQQPKFQASQIHDRAAHS